MATYDIMKLYEYPDIEYYIRTKDAFKTDAVCIDKTKKSFDVLKVALENEGEEIYYKQDNTLQDLNIISESIICPYCNNVIWSGNYATDNIVELVLTKARQFRYIIKTPCCNKVIHSTTAFHFHLSIVMLFQV